MTRRDWGARCIAKSGGRVDILTRVYQHPHNRLFFYHLKLKSLMYSKILYHVLMKLIIDIKINK